MTKVSEEQPRDTFSLFLRLMSIGDWLLKDIRDKAGAAPKEKRKAEPLRARPIPKMRRQRLFLGLSEEIVQFAIDAIHRLNQAIQGAIQRGLIQTLSVRRGSPIQCLHRLLAFLHSYHLNSRPRVWRVSSMPLPTGSNTDWMSGFARTCLRYSLASVRENSGNNMLSATIIAPDPSFG